MLTPAHLVYAPRLALAIGAAMLLVACGGAVQSATADDPSRVEVTTESNGELTGEIQVEQVEVDGVLRNCVIYSLYRGAGVSCDFTREAR